MEKKTRPYLPVATLQQVIDYDPNLEETHTASPIVNAVAEALHTTLIIECKGIADYLSVDERKLAGAIHLDLGMKLIDVIHQYRIHQIQQYRSEHPDESLDVVARACGYASDSSLWRFFQRKLGTTVTGQVSHAGPEHYDVMRKERRHRNK